MSRSRKIIMPDNAEQIIPFTKSEEDIADSEEAVFEASKASRAAIAAIRHLEGLVTQRRIRESVTTDAGKEWLVAIEAEIAEQRELL